MIHKLMLRVLLITLFLSLYLCIAPRPARAQPSGEGAAVLAVVFIVGVYVATMTTICTPVAAIKASNHSGGFGGAFGDCFNWRFSSPQPDQVDEQKEEDAVLSKSPVEESGVQISAESKDTADDATPQTLASGTGNSSEE